MRTTLVVAVLAGAVVAAGCNESGNTSGHTTEVHHPAYHEVWHNGDTYVFPSEETKHAFMETGRATPSKTYINAGKNGSNVVVKVDPANPDMTEWLFQKYKQKHNM